MDKEKTTEVLAQLYRDHRHKLNYRILQIFFVYFALSVSWNVVFKVFDLPYSRANLPILGVCLVVTALLLAAGKFFAISTRVMNHLVLSFSLFVLICLFFSTGYRETWVYALLIPLLSALYGSLLFLLLYSLMGLLILIFLLIYFYQAIYSLDAIDLANTIFFYIIVSTFCYLLHQQLYNLYQSWVSTISKSADHSIEQIVKTFIISIEAKDQYTFGHSERVSKYAVELASHVPEYQKSPKKLGTMQMMGLLHDIGKINIPESILTKESALTNEEYELIKTHTVVGGRMVEKIPLLEPLKTGVLYHHERWDGKGYPTGKQGVDIPLEARIIAIADAFDAMTSHRAYRGALSVQTAFERLAQGRGTQFDPQLIDILMQHHLSWIQIYKSSHNSLVELEKVVDLLL